jgi:hypothetical protein
LRQRNSFARASHRANPDSALLPNGHPLGDVCRLHSFRVVWFSYIPLWTALSICFSAQTVLSAVLIPLLGCEFRPEHPFAFFCRMCRRAEPLMPGPVAHKHLPTGFMRARPDSTAVIRYEFDGSEEECAAPVRSVHSVATTRDYVAPRQSRTYLPNRNLIFTIDGVEHLSDSRDELADQLDGGSPRQARRCCLQMKRPDEQFEVREVLGPSKIGARNVQ